MRPNFPNFFNAVFLAGHYQTDISLTTIGRLKQLIISRTDAAGVFVVIVRYVDRFHSNLWKYDQREKQRLSPARSLSFS